MLRILLADPKTSSRNATRLHLSRYADEWQVVAEAKNATVLLSQLRRQCPDVVILHISLARWSLNDLIADLREKCQKVSVLAVSSDATIKTAVLEAGADAFMYLGDPPSKLITQLRILKAERI